MSARGYKAQRPGAWVADLGVDEEEAIFVRGLPSLRNAYVSSDSGPWRSYDDGRAAHVVPGFGPRHVLHPLCRCHPTLELDAETGLVMVLHQAAQ